jgi:hypothetical protein
LAGASAEIRKELRKMEKRSRILGVILLLCALVLAGAVLLWAQPCGAMLQMGNKAVHMRCFYQKPIGCCAAVLWLAFAADCLKNKRIALLPILVSGLAVVSLSFDWALGIGVCQNVKMACHTTAWWARGTGIAAALAALVCSIDFDRQL